MHRARSVCFGAVIAVVSGSCASAIPDGPGTDARIDGHTGSDAGPPGPIDAPPDGAITAGNTLLLSEITLTPDGKEFIEIFNPGATAVDLTNYYVSDSGNYFKLPATGSSAPIDQGDFIAQFPAAAMIAPSGVVTIAFDTAANFQTAYGVAPTYSIGDATMKMIAVSGTPSLTNAGEIVVLFQWNGHDDLVRDVDIMLAGKPSAGSGSAIGNGFVNKTGYTQDGPDTGNTASKYLTDTDAMPPQTGAAAAGKSTKRILLEAGHETQTGGGNGISGDDETSENTAVTWDSTFTAPTPGAVPPALLQ